MLEHKNQQNTFNPKNERIKYNYIIHYKRLKEADDKTCNDLLKHLREYEILNDFKDFIELSPEIVDTYIKKLLNKDISLSYALHNLSKVKEFYSWYREQGNNFKKLSYNDISMFRLSANQKTKARAKEYQECYSKDEIIDTIRQMPSKTIVERRNKAMISLQALCGLRVSELRTIKMKNLKQCKETKRWFVYVLSKDMNVKFCKTREAYFIPYPNDIKENILNWFEELKKMEYCGKDALFPLITNKFNQRNLLELNISKECVKSNSSFSRIFKEAFEKAGYEYLRIHSFRHTIARWAGKLQPNTLNAIKECLGHSNIDTTMQSYSELKGIEVAKILNEEEKNDKYNS